MLSPTVMLLIPKQRAEERRKRKKQGRGQQPAKAPSGPRPGQVHGRRSASAHLITTVSRLGQAPGTQQGLSKCLLTGVGVMNCLFLPSSSSSSSGLTITRFGQVFHARHQSSPLQASLPISHTAAFGNKLLLLKPHFRDEKTEAGGS